MTNIKPINYMTHFVILTRFLHQISQCVNKRACKPRTDLRAGHPRQYDKLDRPLFIFYAARRLDQFISFRVRREDGG